LRKFTTSPPNRMGTWRTKDARLGVNKASFWAALALALAACFALARPAAARAIELGEAVCTAGAASAEAAYALDPARLDCGPGRFDKRARFMRTRVELGKVGPMPQGALVWQTDPASFNAMLIRAEYADGTERLIDVDAQMAVRNWDANGNFWVPIQQAGSPLSALDIVVERPQSKAVMRRMAISSYEQAARENYARTLLYMLLCGTLLVPIVYDLFFYRVLRAKFMIWHLIMTAGTLAYSLFNSGLVMVVWPNIPSFVRFVGVFAAISLTMLGSARFSMLVTEEGKVPPAARRALHYAVLANLAIVALIALDVEAWRMRIVDLYFLSILPVIGATIWALGGALLRGSRAAAFLASAYGALILAGLVQVFSLLGFLPPTDLVDEAIYIGLVVLVLGTSAGVGDRFLIIKAERDRARLTARKLGLMANSDGLTGLLNRRAFDLHRRLGVGQALLVGDIDRFKSINDTYGHQRGDTVLCHAARVIEDATAKRRDAQVFRLGGEEFAVLCPVADEADMQALAEQIRDAIEKSGERSDGFDMPDITISIGGVLGEGQLMHVAFSDADEALYRAKESGRNRCEFAAPAR
jgi:diguanylate cyclase (GGDEF)-like protein